MSFKSFFWCTTTICVIISFLTGCSCEEQMRCLIVQSRALKLSQELLDNQFTAEYTCPRDLDPKTFTQCCNNGDCCDPTISSLAPQNDWLLMVTAILVISCCLFLTALVVICCFWSKCPLYNTCRANYTTSNVIVYSLGKEDPAPLMPAEVHKGDHYKPCMVKIRKMEEV